VGAPHRLPVHVTLREPRKRGVLAVVEHADRPRRHSVLEEVDADAGVLGHTDVGTIDAVPTSSRRIRSPTGSREGGNPGYLQAEPCTGRRDIRLGAADLESSWRAVSKRPGDGIASRRSTSPSVTRSCT